jgi:hypothetical protein
MVYFLKVTCREVERAVGVKQKFNYYRNADLYINNYI